MSATCPVCHHQNGRLLYRFSGAADRLLLDKLQAEAPGWRPEQGVCSRCLDQAQVEGLLDWPAAFHGDGGVGEVNGYRILPTPVRVQAHPAYTGKGVTICMIDSGFFAHPDLTAPDNRVLAFRDLVDPARGEATFREPHPHSWHGTMTSVVCAGNGRLSGGLYYGIARDARLVLLKVMRENGQIDTEAIAGAVRWAVAHRDEYGIRIINLSLGDKEPVPSQASPVNQAIAEALAAGMVVVAAAGNSAGEPIVPPASSPDALTIGGLDDHNTLDPLQLALYHSTFGRTLDGFFKPEIIAPAVWIAAPILPGAAEHREAGLLFDLWASDDRHLAGRLAEQTHLTRLDPRLSEAAAPVIRNAIRARIDEGKYIHPHYQHADGTSFAAPIVCGVIAQMLEANPDLTPGQIKDCLFSTARPLNGADIQRQGFGVLQPAQAVLTAAGALDANPWRHSPFIDYQRQSVDFHLLRPGAAEVHLAGAFTNWTSGAIPLQRAAGGYWSVQIPAPPPGAYAYKFVLDGVEWMPDPRNIYREPDGFNGFNSQLIITPLPPSTNL